MIPSIISLNPISPINNIGNKLIPRYMLIDTILYPLSIFLCIRYVLIPITNVDTNTYNGNITISDIKVASLGEVVIPSDEPTEELAGEPITIEQLQQELDYHKNKAPEQDYNPVT